MKAPVKLLFLMAVISLFVSCNKQDNFYEENSSDIQLKSADNRTVQMHFYANEDQYWLPVICNDEIVDYLTGDGINLEIHGRMHYEGGKMKSLIATAQGTLQSQLNKEIFTIHEQNRIYFDENEIINEFTAHTNAVGNMGTHLIISMIVTDFNSGTYDLTKAMCVPNSDKD